MTLTVRDAAKLLNVSEKTIYRWISERRLPARRIGDQYRLGRAELLDWVAANRAEASIELYTEPDQEAGPLPSLEAALSTGGIVYRVEGRTRDEVLRAAVEATRLPEGVSASCRRASSSARRPWARASRCPTRDTRSSCTCPSLR
jgi:PTS system nitrogen regulatory IIA component